MDKNDCRVCGETKPITEFVRENRLPGGFRNLCKQCKSAENAEYLSDPRVRARQIEYQRAHGHLYRGRYEINWSKYNATVLAWHKKHPNAKRAYRILHKAIDAGTKPRVAECLCVKCGAQATHYHHHNGYGKGHELDVIALCVSCHRREHSPYPWPEEGLTANHIEDVRLHSATISHAA